MFRIDREFILMYILQNKKLTRGKIFYLLKIAEFNEKKEIPWRVAQVANYMEKIIFHNLWQ